MTSSRFVFIGLAGVAAIATMFEATPAALGPEVRQKEKDEKQIREICGLSAETAVRQEEVDTCLEGISQAQATLVGGQLDANSWPVADDRFPRVAGLATELALDPEHWIQTAPILVPSSLRGWELGPERAGPQLSLQEGP